VADGDAAFDDHLTGQLISISLTVDNSGYSGVDNHFCTDDTWHGGTVQCCTINVGAMLGGLYDGILFGVKPAAELMALTGGDVKPLAQAADRFTVSNPGRDAIIAGGEDVSILNQKRSHLPT
jgi:hypothetical protein